MSSEAPEPKQESIKGFKQSTASARFAQLALPRLLLLSELWPWPKLLVSKCSVSQKQATRPPNHHLQRAFWHHRSHWNFGWILQFWIMKLFLTSSMLRHDPKPRKNDLRERIPHTWPSFHENYFQSILGSVSCCVVILRTPPYWSVREALRNFKLGG